MQLIGHRRIDAATMPDASRRRQCRRRRAPVRAQTAPHCRAHAAPLNRRCGFDPPGLPASISRSPVQRESGFRPAGAGLGGHTPRSGLQEGACVRGGCFFGVFRRLSMPSGAKPLLDRAYAPRPSHYPTGIVDVCEDSFPGAYSSHRRSIRAFSSEQAVPTTLSPRNRTRTPAPTSLSCPICAAWADGFRSVDGPMSSPIPASRLRIPGISSARYPSRSPRTGARKRRIPAHRRTGCGRYLGCPCA